MNQPLLEMRAISKSFPGVKALDNVNLIVQKGEIHALCGENGAGKSTLMKVLSGVYPSGEYQGDILLEGELAKFKSIADSESQGVIIIHQELALVTELTIAENIFLGNELQHHGVIDWLETLRQAKQLLNQVGLREAPTTLVDAIGVGKQQMVEIAKALSKRVKLLILDEPTAALQEDDSAKLLELLLELKNQGVTSILISHKLNEVKQVADSITVLRDGQSIKTRNCSSEAISEDQIVSDMVGRKMQQRFPSRNYSVKNPLFEVIDWSVYHPEHSQRKVVSNVNLHVREGEIVGIAGLMGAGRTELAMSIFGQSYGQGISGQVKLRGEVVDVSSVPKAINHGIAYVTEDRKNLGLILNEDIVINTTLANLEGVSHRSLISEPEEYRVAERYRQALRLKTDSVKQKTVNLSGGNQQKVVLSKWLFTEPELLILDEPTRGIDVGAKYEIYKIVHELAQQGKAVLVISSEMPELLGLCDRIYVMNEGQFVAEMDRADASQEAIMSKIVQNKIEH